MNYDVRDAICADTNHHVSKWKKDDQNDDFSFEQICLALCLTNYFASLDNSPLKLLEIFHCSASFCQAIGDKCFSSTVSEIDFIT